MATMPAAMSAIIIGTVKGLIRFGPRSIRAVWLFSISSMPPMPELTITPTSSGFICAGSRPAWASACLDAARANWQYRPMWRAVLRSMYSSGLKPLTSAAILVSKLVVSKRVIRPTPDTPSTMFDHTVSRWLPIGVMKPIPVTATRVPLDLTLTKQRIRTGRPSHTVTGWEKDGPGLDLMSKPIPTASDQLTKVQGQLQPEAARGGVELRAQELAQLVQAVEDRVPVQVQGGGGVLHGRIGEVGLQRVEQLLAVAGLLVEERTEAVGHEAFRETWILSQNEVRDHFVVSVRERLRPQLAAGFDGLLGLQVRPRDAAQPGVVAADPGPDPRPSRAGSADGFRVQLGHELARTLCLRS